MKSLWLSVAVLAAALGSPALAQDTPAASGPAVVRARDITDRIGVNVHVEYTDGRYADVRRVIGDLKYLGVNLVRDAAPNPANQGQAAYGVLAKAGIRFDMFINDPSLSVAVARLDSFARANPGAIAAVEGPNEISHLGNWTYGFFTGDRAAAAFQKDLFASVHAAPALAKADVYSYSLGAESRPRGGYDYVSYHPYPQNGSQPYVWIEREISTRPDGSTAVLTETGYATVARSWMGVDKEAQAKLTLNALLDAPLLGLKAVYLYELLDAYPDPDGRNVGKHYGLFNYDTTPKPAAKAIHNLTRILADEVSTAATFTPVVPAVHLTGLPATARSLVIAKASGGIVQVALWNEAPVWSGKTFAPVGVAPASVSVAIDGAYSQVRVYEPLNSERPVSAGPVSGPVSVTLVDAPVIVEFIPAPAATHQ
jgi:hypothetical protein